MFLMDDIHERIQVILEQSNVSIAELSNITGSTKKTVRSYIDNNLPSIEFLFALVEYLHVKPDYIFLGKTPVFMTQTEIEKLDLK